MFYNTFQSLVSLNKQNQIEMRPQFIVNIQ